MAYMSILLMEDFILDQSMDYTTSTVISTFFILVLMRLFLSDGIEVGNEEEER